MPQASATFLALGLVQYILRVGSLRYPQRQGCCSFSFVQHSVVGAAGDVIAGKHGASSDAMHVTAPPTSLDASSSSAASSGTARKAVEDDFSFICILVSKRERDNWEKANWQREVSTNL
ncbi:hypothetical protein CDL15_Pgr027434 [Punica granatum]|uniref:Secreted protein n=1 Tax=Punica granatum TaxID=22663 RepID=A0A218XI85_PUNGR|nr:hypothetical protein CDL15_Pgr027434 [Punica granatum]